MKPVAAQLSSSAIAARQQPSPAISQTIQPGMHSPGHKQSRSPSKEAVTIGGGPLMTIQANASSTQPRLNQKLNKVSRESNHRRGAGDTANGSRDGSNGYGMPMTSAAVISSQKRPVKRISQNTGGHQQKQGDGGSAGGIT